MKLAIMQPYIFPYLGYFQMVAAVDRFVLYDDVTFIKQGWINRNRLLSNGKEYLFTINLKKASSFTNIRDTQINEHLFPDWKRKFFATIEHAYKRAPFYEPVRKIIAKVLDSDTTNISILATLSIKEVCNYLAIDTEIIDSSTIYNNAHLSGQERVLDICKQNSASHYINATGGMELYSKEDFAKYGMQLSFIKSKTIEYPQFDNQFVPWLSIIDVLMFNSIEKSRELLQSYELL